VHGGTVTSVTWPFVRAALPFLSGVVGGAAVIIGFLIMWHSTAAIRDRDWQYFTVQFLCAACISLGGLLFLFTVLELEKE
jgi:hypothetical protein